MKCFNLHYTLFQEAVMQTAALNIQSILETTSARETKFSLTPSLELVTATVEQDESHDFTLTRHYSPTSD